MLLRVFEADAAAKGLAPVYLDARSAEPNPLAVREALDRCAGDGGLAGYCRDRQTPILLIDGFEHWQALSCWFRQTYLPTQPVNLKVVFASRHPPPQEWQIDPGWRPLLTVIGLAALTDQVCEAYLWRRHLNPAHRDRLIAFSRGHPLALAVAADAADAGQRVPACLADADYPTVRILLDSFTRDADDPDKRRALDAAAVARELSESLLAYMLSLEDAGPLFDWLRGLSFVTQQQTGIALDGLVRETLMRDMREHHVEHYKELARNAVIWFLEQLEASPGLSRNNAATLGEQALFALRMAPVVEQYVTPVCADGLYLDGWRAADGEAAQAMIAQHLGETALYWFNFWLARAPESIVVVRDASQQLVGLFVKLAMASLAPEDRDADPMARKLWRYLQSEGHLHPGDHVPFIRLCVTRDGAGNDTSARLRLLMAFHTCNLVARNLRVSAQVIDEGGQQQAKATALGWRRLPHSETRMGDRSRCIVYNDWSCEPPARYYRGLAARVFDCVPDEMPQATEPAAVNAHDVGRSLDETAFARAAVAACKQFHCPERLATNPLLQSALVTMDAGPDATTDERCDSLRTCLENALESLADNGAGGGHHAQVLHAADFGLYKNHREAAASLYMGYSTFRRHLGTAREALVAELWRREKAQRQAVATD